MQYRSVHEIGAREIHRHYEDYAPVFVLSNGRAGSKYVAELLARVVEVEAHHEPFPTLMGFSRFAHDHQDALPVLQGMFNAARQERILAAYLQGKVYVESNQTLTFFAPAIRTVYPRARFVHLVRHPADFVVSAMRRGYFESDTLWTEGRPSPAAVALRQDSALERCCWFWREVNDYLEDFGRSVGTEAYRLFRAEDLWRDPAIANEFIGFVGGGALPETVIRAAQAVKINTLNLDRLTPENVRRNPGFPDYAQWRKEDRELLGHYCGDLAERLGYSLDGSSAPLSATTGEQTVPETGLPARHAATPDAPPAATAPCSHDGPRPLLSVLVTTWNSARYLRQCVDSVLAQSYPNIEVILSDDGSQDRTVDIIRELSEACPDRVRGIYSESSTGASANRNRALRAARGEYITTVDGDDFYWDAAKLEREMAVVLDHRRKYGKDVIGFSDVVFVDEAGAFAGRQWPVSQIREGAILDDLLVYGAMMPRDYIARREAYQALGGWREDLRTSNTWDVMLKLAAAHEFHFSGVVGIAYRRHDHSLTAMLPWLERTNDAWRVFYSNLYALVPEAGRRADLEKRFRGFMAQWDWELNERAANLQRECDARLQAIGELDKVAAERLELIRQLHQECDARQQLIGDLQQVAEARQDVIMELQQVADERLALIQRLDAELKAAHKQS